MGTNKRPRLKTSEEIWEWQALPPSNGRGIERANKTGLPLLFPDFCLHPATSLMLSEEGEIFCFLCGCRPPRYFKMQPDI